MTSHSKPALWLTVCSLLFIATTAHAGPPYQTDDPDPVPLHHYEAYVFTLSDATSTTGTALSSPAFEVNWGAAPNLQLHLIASVATNFPPDNGPVNTGFGDLELGAKYRFVKETRWHPEIGIFPMLEAPTGTADRGLGVGSAWFRLPVWIQKSWGPWTTYGGAGALVFQEPGYKNAPFAGWLLQRQINKQLTLGTELFYHGAENLAPEGVRHATMTDLGGTYGFTDHFQLLFAAGHSIKGHAETYTYLGLYWTWGHNAEDDAEAKDASAAKHK
jgi:hypothetical protein